MKTVTDLDNIMVTVLKFCLYFRLDHYIAGGTWPFFLREIPSKLYMQSFNYGKKLVYVQTNCFLPQ